MIGAIAALVLVVANPTTGGPFDARLRQSAAAAQALQGPLDGRWTLSDPRGHTIYVLQLADPPQGAGPLQGAWRDPGGDLGPVDAIARSGENLVIVFTRDPGHKPARLQLRHAAHDEWRGQLRVGGESWAVRLVRG